MRDDKNSLISASSRFKTSQVKLEMLYPYSTWTKYNLSLSFNEVEFIDNSIVNNNML